MTSTGLAVHSPWGRHAAVVDRPRFSFDVHPSPWRRAHHVTGAALVITGAVVATLSWYRLSGLETFREQAGWVVLSVLAGGLCGLGFAVWLLAGLRAVRRGQRDLLRELRGGRAELKVRLAVPGPAGGSSSEVVTARGMAHFHRPSCRLVRTKSISVLSAADVKDAGLRPCGVCEP